MRAQGTTVDRYEPFSVTVSLARDELADEKPFQLLELNVEDEKGLSACFRVQVRVDNGLPCLKVVGECWGSDSVVTATADWK